MAPSWPARPIPCMGSRPCPDRRRSCGSPSFFGKIRRFLGPEAGDRGDSGWDNHPHGLPTIDEAFVNFRSIGGAISMVSAAALCTSSFEASKMRLHSTAR